MKKALLPIPSKKSSYSPLIGDDAEGTTNDEQQDGPDSELYLQM